MAKEQTTAKEKSSPLYTSKENAAKKASFIRKNGTHTDGAYRFTGRKREDVNAEIV